MILERTQDYPLIREILTNPDIYDDMGDDSMTSRQCYQVNTDPLIWYMLVRNPKPVGLFVLLPQGMVCREIHAALLPHAGKQDKREAARELIRWLRQFTYIKAVIASIPENNRKAIVYGTHGLGMHYVGRYKKAFRKHGKLEDLVLLGRSI